MQELKFVTTKVGDRSIVTLLIEDTTWDNKRYRRKWLASVKRSYISYLIKEGEADKIKEWKRWPNPPNPVDPSWVEKQINHSIRGKWMHRVIKELLGIEALAIYRMSGQERLNG